MSTNQEYWDVCLINVWRKHGMTNQALALFRSITGLDAWDCDLLRCPQRDVHYPNALRVFVANRLPKISEWLLKCGPEHDKLLLKKLSASKYTVQATPAILPDPEKQTLYRENAKNKAIAEFTKGRVLTRNSDTDWGTVKGSSRRSAL